MIDEALSHGIMDREGRGGMVEPAVSDILSLESYRVYMVER
jgi:hypothetical protein